MHQTNLGSQQLVTDYEPDEKGDRDCDREYTGNPLRYCAGANCLDQKNVDKPVITSASRLSLCIRPRRSCTNNGHLIDMDTDTHTHTPTPTPTD